MQPVTKEAYKLLHEGSLTLAQMEANGIRVDVPYLDKMLDETLIKIKDLKLRLQSDPLFGIWKKMFGDKTKLTAKEQLAYVLYEEGLYKPTKFTEKTKRIKADKEAFSGISHPFVKTYQEMLKLADNRTKYLKGIKREVVDGYLHPFFNLHTTNTFRSSSAAPNAQNFPKRDGESADLVRKCFIPREGNYFGEIDFSGAEIRVGACLHRDPVMVKYIKDPTTDMHRDTAMELFLLTEEQVDRKTTRDWSKNRFVFPQFYGSVYFQCAPHIWEVASDEKYKLPSGVSIKTHLASKGITSLGECDPDEIKRSGGTKKGTFVHHVKSVEDSFWNDRFKVYTKWKKKIWREYQEQGYITSKTGFCFRWGEKGPMVRNDVLDYETQCLAFQCLLWFLIEMQKWLTKYKMKTLLISQIHDSANFDIYPKELQDVLHKARELITQDLPRAWKWIIVPLEADTEISPVGKSWFEIEKWEIGNNGLWGPKNVR